MSSEERRFVLWGLKEGWSAPRIGQALGVNPATVRRFRSRFSKEPQLLLDLDLYETVGRATNDEYRCLVCGAQVTTHSAIAQHVLGHYVTAQSSENLPAEQPADLGDRGAGEDGTPAGSPGNGHQASSAPATDSDGWHDAFERLAAELREDALAAGESDPDTVAGGPPHTQPSVPDGSLGTVQRFHGPVDAHAADARPSGVPGEPAAWEGEIEGWHAAFEQLAAGRTAWQLEREGHADTGEVELADAADEGLDVGRPADDSPPRIPSAQHGVAPPAYVDHRTSDSGGAPSSDARDIAHAAADRSTGTNGTMGAPVAPQTGDRRAEAHQPGNVSAPPRLGRIVPSTLAAVRRVPSAAVASITSVGGVGKRAARAIARARHPEVTTISIEHGSLKILVSRGLEVLDYVTVPVADQIFREGLVGDELRMATLLRRTLHGMGGKHRRIITAVPGYQTTMRQMELPNVRGLDPRLIIPREASRTMGVSPETSYVRWQRLPGSARIVNWLVISATNRSISSLTAVVQAAGLRLVAIEPRPFPLARSIDRRDAICAWVAADGCDAVVVRDYVPVAHQTVYWGAGPPLETEDLANRVTEVVGSAIAAYEEQSPEARTTDDIPLFVSGSPAAHDPGIGHRVAANLGRSAAKLLPPLSLPPGFPVHDLIVNIGLALRAA